MREEDRQSRSTQWRGIIKAIIILLDYEIDTTVVVMSPVGFVALVVCEGIGELLYHAVLALKNLIDLLPVLQVCRRVLGPRNCSRQMVDAGILWVLETLVLKMHGLAILGRSVWSNTVQILNNSFTDKEG